MNEKIIFFIIIINILLSIFLFSREFSNKKHFEKLARQLEAAQDRNRELEKQLDNASKKINRARKLAREISAGFEESISIIERIDKIITIIEQLIEELEEQL